MLMISCYMKDRSFMAKAEYCAQFKLSPLYETNPARISSVLLSNKLRLLKSTYNHHEQTIQVLHQYQRCVRKLIRFELHTGASPLFIYYQNDKYEKFSQPKKTCFNELAKEKSVALSVFLVCGLLLGSLSAFAQTPVRGKVTSESGTPVAGAGITVKGTTAGTVTDNNGDFSIWLPVAQ